MVDFNAGNKAFLPPKPKISLAKLRENHPEPSQIMDELILSFAQNYAKEHSNVQSFGLEKTIELTEELYDNGFLKCIYDPNTKSFIMGIWDPLKGEYMYTFPKFEGR